MKDPGVPFGEGALVATFASTLIAWQRKHGRQSLPWQQLDGPRDAYRVWLAEVMLQQTQVAAVVPFYRRFIDRFPDVRALAAASLDDVMQHWSGLGYYSRARNLHAAAFTIVDAFEGRFPDDVATLATLPGVGRSTAGAIAAFAYGRRAAILEGNVKRVFARVFLIEGIPASSTFARRAWMLAERLLPDVDIERYTQGLMDLGATICTPRRPACLLCPFGTTCGAHREGREDSLPERASRKVVPHRRATLLLALRKGRVLMRRRPPSGIWGGLWSLPELDGDDEATCVEGRRVSGVREPGFVHAFTHYVLEADVLRITLDDCGEGCRVEDRSDERWVGFDELTTLGLPTPIRALLARNGATSAS